MNYETTDIPYEKFKQIGISKTDILNMKTDELKALLSGRATELKTLTVGEQKIEAKISMYPESDGSVNLKIHPIREKVSVPEKFNLSDSQKTELEKGNNIVIKSTAANGLKEPFMLKLDKDTNEVYSTRVANIKIPGTINSAAVDAQQKKNLLEGKTIELNDGEKLFKVAIDITNVKGYKVEENENTLVKDKKKKDLNTEVNLDSESNAKGNSKLNDVKSKAAAFLIAGVPGVVVQELTKNKERKGRTR